MTTYIYVYVPASAIDMTGRNGLNGIVLAVNAPGNSAHWLRSRAYWMTGCIDAPEEMPAGSCIQISAETDEREITYMPEQSTVTRETMK